MKIKGLKRNVIGALIVIILVLCIGLFMKNKTNTLNNTSINEENIVEELDDNLIGAYIQQGEEYVKADTIPTSGYEFNDEESYCTVNNENINATLNYDMETQTLSVTPLTTKGTKCYLYFDEKASAGETILASPNAPTGQTTDWTGETTYYYTGMIYQGTSPNTTGSGTQIGGSAFNSGSSNNVGYMYTSGQRQGLGTSSTIKTTLDNWYLSNLRMKQNI